MQPSNHLLAVDLGLNLAYFYCQNNYIFASIALNSHNCFVRVCYYLVYAFFDLLDSLFCKMSLFCFFTIFLYTPPWIHYYHNKRWTQQWVWKSRADHLNLRYDLFVIRTINTYWEDYLFPWCATVIFLRNCNPCFKPLVCYFIWGDTKNFIRQKTCKHYNQDNN